MAQSVLELVLRTRHEGSGVPKATQDLKALEKSTKDFKEQYAGAMAGIGVGIGIIAAASAAIVGLANTTADYARDVRDMARATGTSAEEASILINVADDLQVSFDTLKTAAREMNKDGLQPTLGNIKTLALEYQAISSPVDRAKFAMEHFGKAGIEMQKVLESNVEELDDLAAGARSAGLVMDEEATQAALEYEQAMDGLNDRIMGVQIALGNALIPTLTQTVTGFENTIKVAQALWIQLQLTTGMITQEEASLQAAALAGASLTTETETLTAATGELTTATIDSDAATKLQADTYRTALRALGDFNIGEAQRIELEQAIKLLNGELTQEEIARAEAIGFLTKQLELGNITQGEYIDRLGALATGAATAMGTINLTAEAIRNIPDREVNIIYNYRTNGSPRPEAGDIGLPGGPSAPVIIPPDNDVPIGNQRASGGTYGAGRLVVGERGAEMIFAGQPGYVMNNVDSARLLTALEAIASGMGRPNLTLNWSGSGNVAADMFRARAIAGSW